MTVTIYPYTSWETISPHTSWETMYVHSSWEEKRKALRLLGELLA